MSIVGRTYLEHGEPVVVLVQWRAPSPDERRVAESAASRVIRWYYGGAHSMRTGPRNVLIRRANGELVVRPFRGLRRADAPQGDDA